MTGSTGSPPVPAAQPLLGEWACLGLLSGGAAHGWAMAKRLRPDGDVGRVWHLSRPLTYRSLDLLARRGWIAPVAEEPGDAGPNRTILAITRTGRARFEAWMRQPVAHQRDLRSELLLKIVLAEQLTLDIRGMLAGQAALVTEQCAGLADAAAADPDDVVTLWRLEASRAALRFVEQVAAR